VDAKQKFAKFVAGRGLRHTKQRDLVVDAFLATERHVTVQELYDLVRKRRKGVGYATVARTANVRVGPVQAG